MVRIELITGEMVTVKGQSLEQVMNVLKSAGEHTTRTERWVRIDASEGSMLINPSHVVRIIST